MLKRVERHRQKKQDADSLVLDEQWQQILGFQDTDSDESVSENSEDDDHSETSDNRGSLDPSEDEGGEDHEMTVSQALTNPIYAAVSLQHEVMACIICPGKIINGPKMEGLHLASNACTLFLANRGPPSGSFILIRPMYGGSIISAVSLQMLNQLRAHRSCSEATQGPF